MTLDDLCSEAWAITDAAGFHALGHSNAERIALMHSELSEALEAYRRGNPASEHCPDITAAAEEFADVVIRVAEHCHDRGVDLARAVRAKLDFNATRLRMHGKMF